MLSRAVRIPMRSTLNRAINYQVSSVPQVLKETQKDIKQLGKIGQQTTLQNLQKFNINFQRQVDGKVIVLQSSHEVREGVTLNEIGTALFSLGAAYGIVSNFNYLLTLAFTIGAAATVYSSGKHNYVRGKNNILSIHIDTDKRLHLTYCNAQGFDTMIVDKKDFTYNIVNGDFAGTQAIWCRANGTDFWISKKNLQINNHQFHNLL